VRGLFVTGTDTGVGKTILAAAVTAALGATAFKPVVTGLDDGGPYDHEVLGAAAGIAAPDIAPHLYGPAVSPHLAAEMAGESLELDALAEAARAADAGSNGRPLVVEGVGGLLVPLTARHTVRDLAARLTLPLLIAARPGLGTINHTLLTIEAARAAELRVAAVVLTPWPDDPSPMEASNRETIARLGDVEVATLPHTGIDPTALAAAGARLPLERWMAA
jgi:dethiobiotin synthetase